MPTDGCFNHTSSAAVKHLKTGIASETLKHSQLKMGSVSISLFVPQSPSFARHYCFPHSQLLPSNPLRTPGSTFSRFRRRGTTPPRVVISAVQSDLLKVFQTVLRIGKDGIEAGTNFVPEVVPRPVARIGVAFVLVMVSLFVIKSFLSTAFFVLAMMAIIYFAFVTLNKDEGPRGGGGTGTTDEETLEEARRIMEKYK